MKSRLPKTYRHAIRNQYLQWLNLAVNYAGSGHFKDAAECQKTAGDLCEALRSLGEHAFVDYLRKEGGKLSKLYHTPALRKIVMNHELATKAALKKEVP